MHYYINHCIIVLRGLGEMRKFIIIVEKNGFASQSKIASQTKDDLVKDRVQMLSVLGQD